MTEQITLFDCCGLHFGRHSSFFLIFRRIEIQRKMTSVLFEPHLVDRRNGKMKYFKIKFDFLHSSFSKSMNDSVTVSGILDLTALLLAAASRVFRTAVSHCVFESMTETLHLQ